LSVLVSLVAVALEAAGFVDADEEDEHPLEGLSMSGWGVVAAAFVVF